MAIRKRYVPGCRCCTIPPPPCGVFGSNTNADPNSNFTTLAGSWSYAVSGMFGGGLFDPAVPNWSTSSSLAGIALTGAETVVDLPWVLSTSFRVAVTNAAVRLRIAAGAIDISNYLFAEVYLLPILRGGGGPAQYDYAVDRFAIGQRTGGTDTILAQTPYTTGNTKYFLPKQSGDFVYFTPRLCWDYLGTLNGTMTSSFGTDSFGRLSFPISKANVATLSGTFSGVFVMESSTTIVFYDYRLRHAYSETMPTCETCSQSCHAGLATQEWIVEVDDPSPGTVEITDPMSPTCFFECSEIIGSYNVPMDNTLTFGDENDAPLGDSLCDYLLEDIDAGDQCDSTPFEVSISGSVVGGDGESSVTFTMYNTGNPTIFALSSYKVLFQASQSFAYPIEDIPLDTWFDLDVVTTANTCGATGTFTARAKRVS